MMFSTIIRVDIHFSFFYVSLWTEVWNSLKISSTWSFDYQMWTQIKFFRVIITKCHNIKCTSRRLYLQRTTNIWIYHFKKIVLPRWGMLLKRKSSLFPSQTINTSIYPCIFRTRKQILLCYTIKIFLANVIRQSEWHHMKRLSKELLLLYRITSPVLL